jgi:hypothetical protein
MGRVASIWLATIVASGGCAQLFGIEDTTGPTGGDDTPPPASTLTYTRISVGATAVRSPLDVSANTATYIPADTTDPSGIRRVPTTLIGTSEWTAPLTVAAPVFFDLPDFPTPIKRIFDLPVQNVIGLFGVLEHPNAQPAPAGAQMNVDATLDVPYNGTDGLQMYAVGTWQQIGFAGPAAGAVAWTVPTFPFTSVSSLTGRPLEQITPQDAVYLLRYTGNDLQGSIAVPGFTQSVNNALTGTMQTNAHDRTLQISVDTNAPSTRFAQTRPAMSNVAMSWSVVAGPGYQIVSNSGPVLIAQSLAVGASGAINVPYGNPFVAAHDWPDVMTWSTSASRTYTPPALALPVTASTGLYQLVQPTAGMTLDLPAGLPITITMGDTTLTTDGATVTVDPTKAVPVSFVSDVADNTLFQLQLFELVPNATTGATALTYLQKLGASSSNGPSFLLPPELFEVGKTYVLRAVCIQGGFTTISTGDLTNRSLPQAVGYMDSAVFTVAAP